MTVISCLRFATVSGFPSAAEELGSPETNNNQTGWTVFPLKPLHQKSPVPRAVPFWCKLHTEDQLITMLNDLGAQSFRGFNRLYMAFTWDEARKFLSLITTTSLLPLEVSPIPNLPLGAPANPSALTPRENCQKEDGGMRRMCSECPTVNYLGKHKIPAYINEVTCGELSCSRKKFGTCKNAVMRQQFLYKTGFCNRVTGFEELKPYTQEIRVCCKCMVFSKRKV